VTYPVDAQTSDGVRLAPAIRTAVLVGAILTYLNTTSSALSAEMGRPLLKRFALNCLVPFSVSLYSQWSTSRRLRASTTSRRHTHED
jgi:hypothetical protein